MCSTGVFYSHIRSIDTSRLSTIFSGGIDTINLKGILQYGRQASYDFFIPEIVWYASLVESVGRAFIISANSLSRYGCDKDLSRLLTGFKEFTTGGMPRAMLTEVIQPGDKRNFHPMFDKAKETEMVDIFKRGAFEIVSREYPPDNSNVIRGRFLFAIKHWDGLTNLQG